MCVVTTTYIQSSTWICYNSGYGVARHKNTQTCHRRREIRSPDINTNRALNHIDKLGLAELALVEVTFSVYHDVSVYSRLIVRVAVCGIRSSWG